MIGGTGLSLTLDVSDEEDEWRGGGRFGFCLRLAGPGRDGGAGGSRRASTSGGSSSA